MRLAATTSRTIEREIAAPRRAAERPRSAMHRAAARSGATLVALVGHAAILLAFAYGVTRVTTVGDQPAAIDVEIVALPRGGAERPSRQVVAAAEEQVAPAAEPLQEQAAEPVDEPAASVEPVAPPEAPRIVAPKPAAATEKPLRRPQPAKRHAEPLSIAPPTEQPGMADAAAGGMPGSGGAGLEPSDIPSSWKMRLVSHLDRYKRYPQAARAQRAEGTALLSFGMNRDGRVLGYRIVRSTGCPDLDNEVMAMIERASPLPPAPPEVHEQIVQLVVPVRFRL